MNAIPMPIVEAMEAGIPPSKAFRIYSDRSVFDLAEATRLEVGRICLIEAGLKPTRSEASVIGKALDMPQALISGRA